MLRLLPILIGLAGAAKVVYEMVGAPRGRQREEYRFAMEFLRAIKEDPLMHPFLRETGYQAVAGTRVLSADEVEYLLSLQRPDRAIRNYVLGRLYLEYLPKAGDLKIDFRAKYKSDWSRRWRKSLYFIGYIACWLLAFAPFVTSAFSGGGVAETLLSFGVSLIIFVPLSLWALVSAVSISRAEKLVRNQSKHTQKIVPKT